ncbi:MAG TPA: hypothetical protein VFP54_07500 [Acidimicrobiales bacterium]|nr:hypothetical protein [Acidimicrobiales bacterium]
MASPARRPTLSRRRFLALGAAAGAALGTAPTSRASAATTPSLASPSELSRWLRVMANGGPRFTGTRAHNSYIDFLDTQLSGIGLRTHRDRQHFTRWTVRSWGLDLQHPAEKLTAASYYSYSGATPPGGITAELCYCGVLPPPSLPGNPLYLAATSVAAQAALAQANAGVVDRLVQDSGGVTGRIAVVDVPLPPPTPFGSLYADMSYLYDPAGTLGPTADFKRAGLLLLLPTLNAFAAAGALGVIFVVDASAANAAGQYAPFIEPLQGLPALLVDRDTGARLRSAAGTRRKATMVLDAHLQPNTPSDTLWAELPGATDEVIIVNTHTDGPNVAEENGGLALVSLARYFSKLPTSGRRRGLVFLAATGHFAAELKSTNGWVADHQDLVSRAAAGLCLEHLGSREWLDDPLAGYRPSGLPEPALVFHSQTPIVDYGIQATDAAALDRTAFLRPLGATFLGEGAALHEAGVPTLGFIPLPNYLLSFSDNQHLDKVDPRLMSRQIAWAARLIRMVDPVPTAALKAGDSAALPSYLGGQLPVK